MKKIDLLGRRLLAVATALCLGFLGAFSQSCTGNLLQNGGFENGLSNWDGGGEIVATANSGTKALRICQNGVAVRQTLAATAGKIYTLNGSVRRDGGAAPFVFMKFLSATWQPLVAPYANWSGLSSWTALDPLVWTAPAGTAWVEISVTRAAGAGGATDCIFADDLCLTSNSVPPPSGQSDLTLTNLNLNAQTVEVGKVISYRFDLTNASMTAISGLFNVKAYFSTDDVLSANDVQDGIVPTGNFPAGFSATQVLGASTAPASLVPGLYFLILKADADNQIAESNETNNVIVAQTVINVTAPNPQTASPCAKFVGNGTLECAEPVAGTSNLRINYVSGGFRTRATFSATGQLLLNENGGAVPSPYFQPLTIVGGNVLEKKNPDGSVVFSKTLPTATVAAAYSLFSPVEFGTGFALLGWKSNNPTQPYFMDSLFAIKTDANGAILLKKLVYLGTGYPGGNSVSLSVLAADRFALTTNSAQFSTNWTGVLRVLDQNFVEKSTRQIYAGIWSAGFGITKNVCRGWTVTDSQGLGYCKSGGCYASNSYEGEFVNDVFTPFSAYKFLHQSQVGIGTENQDWETAATDGGKIVASRYLFGQLSQLALNDSVTLKKLNAAGATVWTKKVRVPGAANIKKIVESNGQIYFLIGNQNSDWSFVTLECLENAPPPTGPDLILGAFITPSSLPQNGSGTAQIFYQNAGTAGAGAHVYKLYFSANATFDSFDQSLGSFSVASLAPGATGSNSISFTLPAGTTVGAYFLFAKADADGQIAESVESNNEKGNAFSVVVSTSAIAVNCPADMVFSECPQSSNGVACLNCHNIVAPTATTTCAGGAVTVVFDSFSNLLPSTGGTPMSINPTGPFGLVTIGFGSATVKFKITDGCGNVSFCSYKITNNYKDPTPVVTCPANITVTAAAGATGAVVTYTPPTFTSACTFFSPNQPIGQGSGATFPIGTTTVLWTSTNTQVPAPGPSCSFTVTVLAPTAGGCANSLLTNGGFESDLTGWEGVAVISTTASAGVKSAKVCANQNLRQTKAMTAGKALTMSFKAASEGPGSQLLGYIKFLSSTWQPLATEFSAFNAIPGQFADRTFSATAPAGTAWVEIGFVKQTAGCVFVDEVCLTDGAVPPQLPDLTILSMTNPPASVAIGQALPFSFTLKNQGGDIPGGFLTRFYLSSDAVSNANDLPINYASMANWPAGTTSTLSAAPQIPATIPVGTYFLILKADADGQVAELNENNNELISATTISITSGSPTCALTAVSGPITCNNNGTPTNPTDDTFGAAITVSNTGNCGAGWTSNAVPTSGSFGTTPGFGPFPISGGNRTITFAAQGDPTKTVSVTLVAPPTCSGVTPPSGPCDKLYSNLVLSDFQTCSEKAGTGYRVSSLTATQKVVSTFDASRNFVASTASAKPSTTEYQVTNGIIKKFVDGLEVSQTTIPAAISGTYTTSLGGAFERSGGGWWLFLMRSDNVSAALLRTSAAFAIQQTFTVPGVSGAAAVSPSLIQGLSDGSLLLTAIASNPFTDGKIIKTNVAGTAVAYETSLPGRVQRFQPSLCGGTDRFFVWSRSGQGGGSGGSSLVDHYSEAQFGATAATKFSTGSQANLFTQPNTTTSFYSNTTFLTGGDQLNSFWQVATTPPAAPVTTATVSRKNAAGTAIWSKNLPIDAPINTYGTVFEDSPTAQTAMFFAVMPVGPNLFSTVLPCATQPTSGADLKITMTADKTTVPQWSNVTFTVTAKNEGTATISSAIVNVQPCGVVGSGVFDQISKLVYAGTPPPPTAGNYNFITQQWSLTNLAAGATATLTLPLFSTGTSERKVAAWSAQQSPTDPDSQPSGAIFSNCTPSQDDEAVFTINAGNPLLAGEDRAEKGQSLTLEGRDFSIQPNPTTGQTRLFLPLFLGEKMEVEVVDLAGRRVFFQAIEKLESPFFDLDLEAENAGLFFVKVQPENARSVVKRLIINKL